MADDFDDYQSGLDSPAIGAAVVTPSDDTDLPKQFRFKGGQLDGC
jgi:hypothetical protein